MRTKPLIWTCSHADVLDAEDEIDFQTYETVQDMFYGLSAWYEKVLMAGMEREEVWLHDPPRGDGPALVEEVWYRPAVTDERVIRALGGRRLGGYSEAKGSLIYTLFPREATV